MNNLDITRKLIASNNDEVLAQKLATLFDAIEEMSIPFIDIAPHEVRQVIALMNDLLQSEKQEAEDITKLHDLIQQYPTDAQNYIDNMEVDKNSSGQLELYVNQEQLAKDLEFIGTVNWTGYMSEEAPELARIRGLIDES